MIPFNIPYCTGKELHNIKLAIESKKICGNGYYTRLCQQFFENKFGFKKCLLTSSCTDALEMCAILANIKEGDEVIVPSYTLTSSKCWPFGALMTFVTSNLHLSFFKYPESDTWPPLSA